MNENASLPDEAEDKPRSSKRYLDAIVQAEKAFRTWQEKSDNINKLYADLEKQANPARDRQMAIFWANIQVLGPSVYSRPPIPVVVPRFKDRRPLPRAASELLERALLVGFESEDIDAVMREVRDDLNLNGRGLAWLRYEAKGGEYATEKVCIEHKDRKDFLHEPARKWKEVGWVAGRSWLTKDEMRDRFREMSGDAYLDAEYSVQKDDRDKGAADDTEKAGVWEIWHKVERKVIWVTPGVDVVLDEDKPHLTLDGFFPCPKPAYATLQRGSLVPVPDFAYYKDQLEEINELTNRIGALAQAVKVKGFYPAGAGEAADAVETALRSTSDNAIMVPVSNFAAFGSGGDLIVWLPIDMIVQTIASLVELRQQLISDVYEITGLSDIMRGQTDASETATAQQLKSQYGSVRIRDKQHELVRFARDIAYIAAEIMAENFAPKTLLEMSQIEMPTEADIAEQEKGIIAQAEAQVKQALADPEKAQQAQQNPQAAEQMLQQLEEQVQAQIEKIKQAPTVEKVMALLREQRLRPLILDIETDSTIQPDEDAEKQRRAEFLTALGGTLQQLAPMVQEMPQSAAFAGEILKFALAPFRAGRELEGAVDEFVEQMQQQAGQPRPNPEAEKAKADRELKEMELQGKFAIEKMKIDAEREGDAQEQQAKMTEIEAERQRDTEKHQQEMQKGQLEIRKLELQIEGMRMKAAVDAQTAQIKADATERQAQINEAATVQKAEIEADSARQKAENDQRAFEQNSQLAAQKASQKEEA